MLGYVWYHQKNPGASPCPSIIISFVFSCMILYANIWFILHSDLKYQRMIFLNSLMPQDNIWFILHNITLYFAIWIYNVQYGFIFWHMVFTAQCESIFWHMIHIVQYDSIFQHMVYRTWCSFICWHIFHNAQYGSMCRHMDL